MIQEADSEGTERGIWEFNRRLMVNVTRGQKSDHSLRGLAAERPVDPGAQPLIKDKEGGAMHGPL